PHSSITARSSASLSALSLHDALPIYGFPRGREVRRDAIERDPNLVTHAGECGRPRRQIVDHVEHDAPGDRVLLRVEDQQIPAARSEEHTSELQSRENLVCRLLLEKKK